MSRRLRRWSTGTATLVSTSTNWSTTVQGSTPGWLTANARSLSGGVFFTQKQVDKHAQVVVLGATTAQDLGVTVGSQVSISGAPFDVVGILTTTGSTGFTNNDDLAVIPITTAQDQVTGGSPDSVQRILLSAIELAQRSDPHTSKPISSCCRRITSPTAPRLISTSPRRRRWRAPRHR